MRQLEVIDLGLLDYESSYQKQLDLVERRRKREIPDTLILVEHPDVYTYGRKSREATPIEGGVAIERGGEATFHNPGQLVAYPILFLEPGERDLHQYLRTLETAIAETLSKFGLIAGSREGATGVWVSGTRKIASIGVAVRGWVTYHGIALNVANDLAGFARINPCGFDAAVMTSLREELASPCPPIERVKSAFVETFAKEFNRVDTKRVFSGRTSPHRAPSGDRVRSQVL